MILTPEERRAVLALLVMLLFGQGLALWEEHGRSKPDRELSGWLSVLAATRGDSSSAQIESLHAAAVAGDSIPSRAGEPRNPEVPIRGREEIPPGILEAGRIRINAANAGHLELLPGVGPVLARRIVDDRDTNGPFRQPQDLLRVKGIGPRKLAGLEAEVDWSLDVADRLGGATVAGPDSVPAYGDTRGERALESEPDADGNSGAPHSGSPEEEEDTSGAIATDETPEPG